MAPVHLSVCMIVRDEADRLPTCLYSVLPVADELIVIDTGSTDDTVRAARSLGAEVYEFPWCDDFAAARNEAMRHATGDWILVIDADEVLIDDDGLIRQLVARPADGPRAFALTIHNQYAPGQACTLRHLATRLHARHPHLRWQGRIHEQLVNVADGHREVTAEYLPGVTIGHAGYLPDVVSERDKRARNRRLFELDLQDRPDSAPLHFHMGIFLVQEGELHRSLRHLHRALQLAEMEADWPDFGTAAILQAIGLESMVGHHQAASDLARRYERKAAGHPGYWLNRGIVAMQRGEWQEARDCWQAGLHRFHQDQPQVLWDDQALWNVPFLQADLAIRQGDLAEAAAWLAGAMRVEPALREQAIRWSLWLAGQGRRDLAIDLLRQAGAGEEAQSPAAQVLTMLETGADMPDSWATQAQIPRLVAPVAEQPRLSVIILGGDAGEGLATTLSGVDALADELLVATADPAAVRAVQVLAGDVIATDGHLVEQVRQALRAAQGDWVLLLTAGEAVDEAAGAALAVGMTATGGRQVVWGDALREALPAAAVRELAAHWDALGQREPITVVWG